MLVLWLLRPSVSELLRQSLTNVIATKKLYRVYFCPSRAGLGRYCTAILNSSIPFLLQYVAFRRNEPRLPSVVDPERLCNLPLLPIWNGLTVVAA